jgi:hypothetical protein
MRLRGAPSSHKVVPEIPPSCPSPSRIIPDACSLPARGNSPEKRGRSGVPGGHKLWRESGIGLQYARYSITSSVRQTSFINMALVKWGQIEPPAHRGNKWT